MGNESSVSLEQFRPNKAGMELMEWASIRNRRNQLLRDTDYTQVLDSPLTEDQRTAVGVYRKALRDVPQDVGNPFSVVWPDKPDFL